MCNLNLLRSQKIRAGNKGEIKGQVMRTWFESLDEDSYFPQSLSRRNHSTGDFG